MADILILGGDKRLQYVADRLNKNHRTVLCADNCRRIFSGTTMHYDVVILGIPCSTDGGNINVPLSVEKIPFELLTTIIAENGIILGGMIPSGLYDICEEKNIACRDYYKSETIILKNAVPSAEGALALGINSTDKTIRGMNILITGYGRIASLLARYLVSMGAVVTIVARREEKRVLAEINGCHAVDFSKLPAIAGNQSLIYNTVPYSVFDEKAVTEISRNSVYIELASVPGADSGLLARHGITYVNGGGLPSRTAPETAGEIIAESIIGILDEYTGVI